MLDRSIEQRSIDESRLVVCRSPTSISTQISIALDPHFAPPTMYALASSTTPAIVTPKRARVSKRASRVAVCAQAKNTNADVHAATRREAMSLVAVRDE